MEININFHKILQNITFMAIAYILAMPIAWDREKSVRSAGLRTFPLVAVASCGFMLVGISVLSSTDAEARVFLDEPSYLLSCILDGGDNCLLGYFP